MRKREREILKQLVKDSTMKTFDKEKGREREEEGVVSRSSLSQKHLRRFC